MRRRRFEQQRGTVPDQADQACAGLTVTRFNIVRIRPGKRRDDLAVVAPGASPPRFGGFKHNDIGAGTAQMQRRGQAGQAAADDDDISIDRAFQLGTNWAWPSDRRSEEHTSELPSLLGSSYAVSS